MVDDERDLGRNPINDDTSYSIRKKTPKESSNYYDIDDEDMGISAYLPVFRVKVKHYRKPLYIVLVLSGLLAWLTYVVAGVQESIPESGPTSGILNGLLFTASAGISSVLIYLAIKKKGEIALKYMMALSFLMLTFMLSFFFGDAFLIIILTSESVYNILIVVLLVACAIFSVTIVYLFFSKKMGSKSKNMYVLYMSILIGAFMGVVMPTWTTITMLIGISLWDLVSVIKGPIKKIMELTGAIDPDYDEKVRSGEIKEFEQDFEDAEIEIGIGDTSFYSMLTSHALIISGNIIVPFCAAIGVIIGASITISALKKNKILPGLPVSIFLGLIFGLISAWIITIV